MVTWLRYCARNITSKYHSVRRPRGPYALTRAQSDLTISNAGIPNKTKQTKKAITTNIYYQELMSRNYIHKTIITAYNDLFIANSVG